MTNLRESGITGVWVASYWWADCDPIGTVIGTDRKRVEEYVHAAMEAEVYSGEEDPGDGMRWSGVHHYGADARLLSELSEEKLRELVEDGLTEF